MPVPNSDRFDQEDTHAISPEEAARMLKGENGDWPVGEDSSGLRATVKSATTGALANFDAEGLADAIVTALQQRDKEGTTKVEAGPAAQKLLKELGTAARRNSVADHLQGAAITYWESAKQRAREEYVGQELYQVKPHVLLIRALRAKVPPADPLEGDVLPADYARWLEDENLTAIVTLSGYVETAKLLTDPHPAARFAERGHRVRHFFETYVDAPEIALAHWLGTCGLAADASSHAVDAVRRLLRGDDRGAAMSLAAAGPRLAARRKEILGKIPGFGEAAVLTKVRWGGK